MYPDCQPYSYRQDPAVPYFPDDKPVIVFDGHCAFCSGWARFVIGNDRRGRLRLAAAQSPLGRALYVHYGLDPDDYQTNILIADGVARVKSDGTLAMLALLDWPWPILAVLRIVPRFILDPFYSAVARRRLQLAGRSTQCFAPTPDMRERFLA